METLDPALTSILSEHVGGKPIERTVWQNLDDQARGRLSDAIVTAKRKTSAEVRVHLYVCETGARPLKEHLHFRNALRQNPELAAEYAALKRTLANQYRDDRVASSKAKTGFIRSVLASL